MRFLNCQQYDDVLLAALRQLGVSDPAAKRVIASRWPLHPLALPSEAFGRGLVVTIVDVEAFLDEAREETGFELDIDHCVFSPEFVELFLTWCVEQGRAEPTAVGEALQGEDADTILRDLHRRAAAPMN